MADDARTPTSPAKVLLLVAALAAASALAVILRGDDETVATHPSPSASASGDEGDEGDASPPPRCRGLEGATFLLGKPPPPADPDAGDEVDDAFAPFAVILGRGAATASGFAVGVLRDAEGGSVAELVTVTKDGAGKTTRLARSRGDMEAPVVTAYGDATLVAMLEPDAGGRTLRLARVDGDVVTWGAEVPQGIDESLDVDLAVQGDHALVAWDDLDDDHDVSRIILAPFDPRDVKGNVEPRPATGPKVDAETPRLVSRPGGYWLSYVVRGGVSREDDGPPEARDAPTPDDEVDEQRGGERLRFGWIEVAPLDESGAPAGAARRVTPADGHALAYDVISVGDGLVLAWRDERSPLGGGGGTVSMVKIDLSGAKEPLVLADEDVGDGVPSLVPGWILVTPLDGAMLLGHLADDGDLEGALAPEASVGRAQPIAAEGSRLLLGRPRGKAMQFEVLDCP